MKEDILKFSQDEIEVKLEAGFERLEEFEIPEKYKSMISTGKMQKKYGDNYPIPEYITPIDNEVI
jgi:hypothetical protein